ncbi:MAG: hypothetical protein H0V70_01505 [Ktedonobacteraceae bacterium]|nr:hypothetical protein [Ktedonobacteraceae bacterium]
MNTGYRNQQGQQAKDSNPPEWMLFCLLFALALGLIALPWIIISMLTERTLSRWLHWRLSFLVWFVLFAMSAFVLYTSYQHGLQNLIIHEFTAYIVTARHYQTDFAHWPLRTLWADTLPVWMQTWKGIGIVGFCTELFIQPRKDTTQSLRQNERKRQQRMHRSQRWAKRRSIRPRSVPDAIGGMMVMGIAIHDELEGE